VGACLPALKNILSTGEATSNKLYPQFGTFSLIGLLFLNSVISQIWSSDELSKDGNLVFRKSIDAKSFQN
jgi:hypothetical protein